MRPTSKIVFLALLFAKAGLSLICSALSTVASDKDVVRSQLGYLPSNFVSVSARTEDGQRPVAIQSYPLDGGAGRRQRKAGRNNPTVRALGTPFPTLYWLTCPDICRAVAVLEQNAYVREIEGMVRADSDLTERLRKCHQEYAHIRWMSLTETDRKILSAPEGPSRIRDMLQNSGIAGANRSSNILNDGNGWDIPSIKCLHTNYAHYRSTRHVSGITMNPVGEIVHQLLEEKFQDLVL